MKQRISNVLTFKKVSGLIFVISFYRCQPKKYTVKHVAISNEHVFYIPIATILWSASFATMHSMCADSSEVYFAIHSDVLKALSERYSVKLVNP